MQQLAQDHPAPNYTVAPPGNRLVRAHTPTGPCQVSSTHRIWLVCSSIASTALSTELSSDWIWLAVSFRRNRVTNWSTLLPPSYTCGGKEGAEGRGLSARWGTPGVGVSALQEEVGTFPWRLRGCRAPTSRQGLGIQHQGEPFTVY